ncbi:MAG: HAD hydrolase-like protein [Chlorobi bacterium]|nr:HAD hydrolase-like protein [Chlorobiota bacterium]
MRNKKLIIFDLDGTITNSEKGIFNSLKFAVHKFGITEINQTVLDEFIGPSLKYSFSKHFFSNPADVVNAVKYYREYYAVKGIFENELYDGIENTLKQLKLNNKILCIASSKPLIYVKKIAKHFKIEHYFKHITGAEINGTLSDKAELIEQIINFFPKVEKEEIVMIGDRNWDVSGAKKAGIDVIGVTYGFGSLQELQDAGANEIALNTEDILSLVFEK